MFHNFRNQNALQSLHGRQHEVAEFEGDKMVGARGFEPPTPWSRTRKSKIHKCRIWCRLRDRWPLIPALELDGSWTDSGGVNPSNETKDWAHLAAFSFGLRCIF